MWCQTSEHVYASVVYVWCMNVGTYRVLLCNCVDFAAVIESVLWIYYLRGTRLALHMYAWIHIVTSTTHQAVTHLFTVIALKSEASCRPFSLHFLEKSPRSARCS